MHSVFLVLSLKLPMTPVTFGVLIVYKSVFCLIILSNLGFSVISQLHVLTDFVSVSSTSSL